VDSARHEDAGGDAWTGNTDAKSAAGGDSSAADLTPWQWASDGRVQRAALSTRLPGVLPSSSDVLHDQVERLVDGGGPVAPP
jgi:hypothetical protein